MAPAFKQLAGSLRSRVNVVEVNCEKYAATCRTYRIQSFPTLRMCVCCAQAPAAREC